MDPERVVMTERQQVNTQRAEMMGKCSLLYQHALAEEMTPAQLRLNLMKKMCDLPINK